MRGVKFTFAILAIVLTIGLVKRDRIPPTQILGLWRIDTFATRIQPEYAGKDTEHLDAWTGNDTGTLVRIDETHMEFWGDRWPYELRSADARHVSIDLTDPRLGETFEAHFEIRDKYVLFSYKPLEPYVLVRATP